MIDGNKGFPWRRMMELGLGVMSLSPREFWSATPREIAAAFPAKRRDALGRAELDDLMQQFPDEQ